MTCYSIQCIQCVISVLFLFTQLVIVVPYSPHFNMRFYALPSRHAANVIKLPAKGLSLSRASLYSTSSADTLKFVDNDRFSVAPMMDYTDQHQRTLFRFISKRSVLYTEMVTCQALVHAQDKTKFLDCDFNDEEPLVLQLGGSDPKMCREAAAVAKAYGYKEINLNVGCPSDRVADAGCFGAALMAKPDLVADIMLSIDEVMLNSGSSSSGSTCRPSTVKCRIGIDECDSYEYLCNFIHRIHEKAKVNHFIIHARKAILGGKLSPEENRKIPPLKYNYVYRLIQDFPHLKFTINGGILSYEEIDKHFKEGLVHGVMVGRQVVNTPYYWRNIDSLIYHQADPGLSRREILEAYSKYAESKENVYGKKIRRSLVKPIWNLFFGEPNGKQFRLQLENNLKKYQTQSGAIRDIIMDSTRCISDDILDSVGSVQEDLARKSLKQ